MDSTILLLIVSLVASVYCVPKYDDGSFKLSSLDYSEKADKAQNRKVGPPRMRSRSDNDLAKNTNELNDRSPDARFDYSHVADSNVYGVGSHMAGGTDLGGLLLGAVIGIGTILIIPKLLYVFSGSHFGSHLGSHLGSHGAYGRSDDQGGMVQIASRVDDALAKHGIDTTACVQRLACSYSKQSTDANTKDQTSTIQQLIEAASGSKILRGTAIEEAIEVGRSGGNCAHAYHQCSLSPDIALPMLAKLIAGAA
ncbi:hypothetical protein QAD02_023041 [Eretmocerus hayati]|uniref:Uncharacterized protein n=1 Tax=Eretmocerus hayati TaxID=131215 RepID=A0ACC2PUW6_9HYME|nr:hypothetical protein QAD02_023041 [Eretmocerus hayati]